MKIKKVQQSVGYIGSIVDNLNTESAADALSAQQGKILNDKIENLNIPTIENSLTSEATDVALSAAQGKILNETKLNKTGGTISGNLTVKDKIFTTAPVNCGHTKYDCVSGSYVKLFRYHMTTPWKSSSVWFTLCDTQTEKENVLCNLYVHHYADYAQVNSIKYLHLASWDNYLTTRLCTVAVDAHTIDVYFKMRDNDSPAITLLSITRMEKEDDNFGKISIDCNTVVSTLPEGTVTWAKEMTYRPVTLYSNTSGTNGTVTLSETAANFSQLDITYVYSGICRTTTIKSPNGRSVSLDINLIMSGVPRTQLKVVKINEATITVSAAGHMAIAENGSVGASGTENQINITSVIGYRPS